MTYAESPRDKIIAHMRDAGTSQKPREVADATGVDYQYTRQLMPEMAEAGDLTKVGWGTYRIPFDQSQLDEENLIQAESLRSAPALRTSATNSEASARHLFKDQFTISVYYDPVSTESGLRYDPANVHRIKQPPALLLDWLGELRENLGIFVAPSDWMQPVFDQGSLIWYAPGYEINAAGYYAVSLNGLLEPRRVEPLHGGDYRFIPGNPSGPYSSIVLSATKQPGRFVTDSGREVQFWCAGKIIRPTS